MCRSCSGRPMLPMNSSNSILKRDATSPPSHPGSISGDAIRKSTTPSSCLPRAANARCITVPAANGKSTRIPASPSPPLLRANACASGSTPASSFEPQWPNSPKVRKPHEHETCPLAPEQLAFEHADCRRRVPLRNPPRRRVDRGRNRDARLGTYSRRPPSRCRLRTCTKSKPISTTPASSVASP